MKEEQKNLMQPDAEEPTSPFETTEEESPAEVAAPKKKRGRPKGSGAKKAAKKMATKVAKKATKKKGPGPHMFVRDEYGLLENVDYTFKEDGSVDWKAMLPVEHLFVNEEWFKDKDEPIPESAEGLDDEQIVVGLASLKEVARIRGLKSCSFTLDKCDAKHVSCTCSLEFIPNYETNFLPYKYEGVANATIYNVDEWFQLFLETIASNRAFSRAVRNALRIDMVSDAELSAPKWVSQSVEGTGIEMWRSVADQCKKMKVIEDVDDEGNKVSYDVYKFVGFKKYLLAKGQNAAESWDDWSDIPVEKCIVYLGKLKNKQEQQQEEAK